MNEVLTIMKGRSFDEVFGLFKDITYTTTPRRNSERLFNQSISDNSFKIIKDAQKQKQIKHLLKPLLKLFHRPTIKIVIIDDKEIGAYYLSGTALGFTKGLLDNTKDFNEIIGVAAHELSHQVFTRLSFIARKSNCSKSYRLIEHFCDGLAILALNKLELSAQGIIDVLQKIPTMGGFKHPSTKDRIELINQLKIC